MDLLQLKYFQKVARIKHMTQAAHELHITQPSLSQTIAKLEKDLGVPLFNREGRKIELNRYGKAFLEKVDTALLALEEGQREIADMAGLERGSVTLDTTFLPHFPHLLDTFLAKNRHVQFQIVQVSSKEMKEEYLEEGKIDFCLSCQPMKKKSIHNLPIMTEEIVLAVPHGHPLANRNSIHLNEAAGESFISFHKESEFRQTSDEWCQRAGFTPKTVCETEKVQTMNDLVEAGIGVALLSTSSIKQKTPMKYVHIEEPVCQRTYYLSWNEKRYLSLAARAFRTFLIEDFSVNRG